MRKILSMTILALVCLFPIMSFAQNGFTASFKSGFPLSGTEFGLKLGPFHPYGGLDIIRVSGTFSDSYTDWDKVDEGYRKDYYSTSEFDGAATLFVPNVGLKFYLTQKSIKSYVNGGILMVIPSVSGKTSYEWKSYNSDGEVISEDSGSEKLTDEEKDNIKDVLDMFGLKAGFGLEYAFSENFSIGGEYGLRVFSNSITTSETYPDPEDQEDYSWKEEWEEEVKTSLGITYTSFSMNFYF